MTAARFLIFGYQNFAYSLAHIATSYAQEEPEALNDVEAQMKLERVLLLSDKDKVRSKIERRKAFSVTYFASLFNSCFSAICCCLVRAKRLGCCRERLERHKRFKVA